MTRDGLLSVYEYAEFVANNIKNETSDNLLNTILMVTNGYVSLFSTKSVSSNQLYPLLFKAIYELLIKTDPTNTNRAVLLKENLINFGKLSEDGKTDNFAPILDWFYGKNEALKPFELGL